MVSIRKSHRRTEDGRVFVSSYHPDCDKLSAEQKKGCVIVSELPPQPHKPGWAFKLVLNDKDEPEWYGIKKDTPELEELVRLKSEGRIDISDIKDEEVREIVSRRV